MNDPIFFSHKRILIMSQNNPENLITEAQSQALKNIFDNIKYGGTASTAITLLTNSQLLKCIGVGDVDNAVALLQVSMSMTKKQRESYKQSLISA